MLEAFQNHLENSGLIPPGVRVLVGYSGGADSTCLLHLLKLSGVDVVAAHLHHGQREEAADEEQKCREFCEDLDVPFATGKADVPKIAAGLGIGLEEAGRNARYDFFRRAAQSLGCHLIATAHTRTDLVETVLLNVTRGCGLNGLAGIPQRRENIIRPLLPFSRSQTQGYCAALQLWTHSDPANADINFSRARIRHRVLPELAAINPKSEWAIARLASIASEEDAFLDGAAVNLLHHSEIRLNGELSFLSHDLEVALNANSLRHAPMVLVRRGLRLAAEALGGNLEHGHVEKICEGLERGVGGSITSEGAAVIVTWDGEQVVLIRNEVVAPFRAVLTVPGETFADDLGWKVTADPRMPAREIANRREALEVRLGEGKWKGDLILRSVLPGDKMIPFGFDHHRKLSDLIAEAGLTETARKRIPVVCDFVGPLWVPGICLGSRVAANQGEPGLSLLFAPIGSDRAIIE